MSVLHPKFKSFKTNMSALKLHLVIRTNRDSFIPLNITFTLFFQYHMITYFIKAITAHL